MVIAAALAHIAAAAAAAAGAAADAGCSESAAADGQPPLGGEHAYSHAAAMIPIAAPAAAAAAAYRLLPMGSHPRVADKRGTYDLFGPVAKLWGGSYDKAMAGFLACLKEFGDFARAR